MLGRLATRRREGDRDWCIVQLPAPVVAHGVGPIFWLFVAGYLLTWLRDRGRTLFYTVWMAPLTLGKEWVSKMMSTSGPTASRTARTRSTASASCRASM